MWPNGVNNISWISHLIQFWIYPMSRRISGFLCLHPPEPQVMEVNLTIDIQCYSLWILIEFDYISRAWIVIWGTPHISFVVHNVPLMTFNLPGLTLDFVTEVKGFNFDKKFKLIYLYLFIVHLVLDFQASGCTIMKSFKCTVL